MLKKLINRQRQYIEHFFDGLSVKSAEKLFKALLHCQGTIYCTGVGKSGFIAQKVAATMVSTGTKALFIPPLDALHGDLGIVSSEDVFLMFSKSGETEELNTLLPYLKSRKIKVYSLTSNGASQLAVESDMHVCLPLERELCPFDLAPTTSMSIQLLFGDVLTVGLMKAKNFSLSEYAKNHPSGRIGRRAQYSVEDLMVPLDRCPLISQQESMRASIVELSSKRCGCVLVVGKDHKLEGILTDGDVSRCLRLGGERVLSEAIANWMTKKPRVTNRSTLAWLALQEMETKPENPITVLPVVNREGQVEGLIRLHDILQKGI